MIALYQHIIPPYHLSIACVHLHANIVLIQYSCPFLVNIFFLFLSLYCTSTDHFFSPLHLFSHTYVLTTPDLYSRFPKLYVPVDFVRLNVRNISPLQCPQNFCYSMCQILNLIVFDQTGLFQSWWYRKEFDWIGLDWIGLDTFN